ncbi:MAG: hypothetical protein CO030_04950 [Candidatus Magasanikbacteria bacterium CG_4_9_14_0_2_um_filter_42_11]|uniref:Uncharacterized protein n=1 Tax=Candidatus Magasanikbacteria bacterium CG_4_9_14_0_2_um_filter_42_11 TaxID=1974643 RepID=A0A2M8F8I2_9BACT|nr:MAG: hypothetical protein COU34_04615 [Candidatus Magasanikbacteria bacterium CG10_big_fil_rev_8_21_14_0_10_43_9]PIY92953.1 MAG: hypothetical protein COY70_00540 [Candidatus Magasanikbacteria bacterium CG_4_10_14_0_8_um_filter_42_12]PJC52040.1 MAG: hypothetical protein CO030_04950 [Candidatus Magasanikbacteria bacterium CG_4_9_14_0_2_um_filter_42_11]
MDPHVISVFVVIALLILWLFSRWVNNLRIRRVVFEIIDRSPRSELDQESLMLQLEWSCLRISRQIEVLRQQQRLSDRYEPREIGRRISTVRILTVIPDASSV